MRPKCFRRVRPLLALALLTVAVGCSGQQARLDEPELAALSDSVTRTGLDSLRAEPLLEYRGTQIGMTNNTDDPVPVTWRVVADGSAALGSATVDGRDCTVLSIDGLTYVNAPDAFWTDEEELTDDQVDVIDGGWVRVHNQSWFDPATFLTGEVYAESLAGVLRDTPGVGVDEPTRYRGRSVLPVIVGDGFVYFDASTDAIVGTADVAVESLAGTGYGFTGSVTGLDRDTATAFRDDLLAAVEDLGEVYFLDIRVDEVVQDDADMDCSGADGTCEVSAEITASSSMDDADPDYDLDYDLIVDFVGTSWIEDHDSDTSTCTETKRVHIGDTRTMSCRMIAYPVDGRMYHVEGEVSSDSTHAVTTPDAEDIADGLSTRFIGILAEL